MFKEIRKAAREWVRNMWSDLKESTDTTLLGIPRFFGLLYGPIDRTQRIDEALRRSLQHRVPGHVTWKHALGGITYVLFLLLVVTGVLLTFYYRPSSSEAYQSLQHLVSEVPFGWLVRDVHVWAANLILVAIVAHMARVFLDGAYKPPRESNWLVGILLLFVVLAFGVTGYLLPWDQWAYWATTEAIRGVEGLPIAGGLAAEIMRGDEIVSGATLSRYFAVHVVVLPWLALVLLVLHFMMTRRHGPAASLAGFTQAWRRHDQSAPTEEGTPFFPHHFMRIVIATVFTLGLVGTLALLWPRPFSEAADPYRVPETFVSTWFGTDAIHGIVHVAAPWGLLLFIAFGLAFMFLPLFDRSAERRIRRRPVAGGLAVATVLLLVLGWLIGGRIDEVHVDAVPADETVGQVGPGSTAIEHQRSTEAV